MSSAWTVRLARQAELDYLEILRWTARNFGLHQAQIYAQTLGLALDALHGGPDVLGARARDDIEPGIRVLHVARDGRQGRHLVVFRVGANQLTDVLRLLHDSMDLARHLPAMED